MVMKKWTALFLPLGLILIGTASLCFRLEFISDFQKGFLEGMGSVLTITGIVSVAHILAAKRSRKH